MIEPEQPFNTVVLGETGVGKSYQNLQTLKGYCKAMPKLGKSARKGIVLNFQNEAQYDVFRTLKPTPEEIRKFVNQQRVEIRQIKGIDEFGNSISSTQKVEIMKLISANFRNGLVVYDDIDAYAAFSNDKDLVGSLMGNRHKGMDGIFAHQAWRKISVTEIENLRFIRLHKTRDNPMSMPSEKQAAIDIDLCMIANYAVTAQYDLANNLFNEGKINKAQRNIYRSYFVNIDMREGKIYPVSENNFNLSVKRYCSEFPQIIKKEFQRMIFEGVMKQSQSKEPAYTQIAIQRLQKRFKNMYLLPKPKQHASNNSTTKV